MNIRQQLDDAFGRQPAPSPRSARSDLARYARIAEGYAEMENALAVLSDLEGHESVVFHGRFSETLDIDASKCSGTIPSIWEEEIFRAIHPDDLERKLLRELLFFHHINRLPPGRRFTRCLVQRLRMRRRDGAWAETLHRLYYIPAADKRRVGFALCLYGAAVMQPQGDAVVVDTATGQTARLDSDSRRILTPQEIAVLKLVDEGLRSRDIATRLHISVHTVSRHRQNILAKLKASNSAEACRTARHLAIL